MLREKLKTAILAEDFNTLKELFEKNALAARLMYIEGSNLPAYAFSHEKYNVASWLFATGYSFSIENVYNFISNVSLDSDNFLEFHHKWKGDSEWNNCLWQLCSKAICENDAIEIFKDCYSAIEINSILLVNIVNINVVTASRQITQFIFENCRANIDIESMLININEFRLALIAQLIANTIHQKGEYKLLANAPECIRQQFSKYVLKAADRQIY